MAIANDTMLLRVVTPLGIAIEERAASIVLQTALGQIEVLPGHAPTVVLLEPGEMRARDANGADRVFAAGEGFAQVDGESVTAFSDMAEDADGIALGEAEEAKSRAETALRDAANLSDDERHLADLAVRESLVKIQLTLRRKGRGPSAGS
jgi:F-type H+-transporting ATPase subunit epsilon